MIVLITLTEKKRKNVVKGYINIAYLAMAIFILNYYFKLNIKNYNINIIIYINL